MEITRELIKINFLKYLSDKDYSKLTKSKREKIFKRIWNVEIKELIKKKYNLEKLDDSSRTKVKEGWVYIMTNPSFQGMVKVGSSINVNERLKTFQTYDPYRKYALRKYEFFQDRRKAERYIHKILNGFQENGEWFKIEKHIVTKILFLVSMSQEDRDSNKKDRLVIDDMERIAGKYDTFK